MARKKNRNIVLIKSIKELSKEVRFSEYMHKDHFTHICDIIPNKKEEKLEIKEIDHNKTKEDGLVYILVIKNKIFKIGQSITNITKRVQSYNCGKTEYRISGTNSTTNYFVLQSLLNLNERINVYAYFTKKQKYEIFGEHGEDSFPSSKVVERKVMKDFIHQYKKKPIANTQR